MQIIPAIDIIEGKCVRLTKGDFEKMKIYNENPLEVALQFEDIGLQRLHLVDLDGARSGKVANWKVLEKIAGATTMEIDFGGGIKTEEDVNIVFNSGAKWATIGSLAVKQELLFLSWLESRGSEKFILGADVRDEKLAIQGWTEQTDTDIFAFLEKYTAAGIEQVFCTDISKDGLLSGPSTDLYRKILDRFPSIFFIASGGVTTVDDLHTLAALGCQGAIVGKAIYENRISLKEISEFNNRYS